MENLPPGAVGDSSGWIGWQKLIGTAVQNLLCSLVLDMGSPCFQLVFWVEFVTFGCPNKPLYLSLFLSFLLWGVLVEGCRRKTVANDQLIV